MGGGVQRHLLPLVEQRDALRVSFFSRATSIAVLPSCWVRVGVGAGVRAKHGQG